MNYDVPPVRRRHIDRHAEMYLRSLHEDPFVQAAVWRLYAFAPDLLDPPIRTGLDEAVEADE